MRRLIARVAAALTVVAAAASAQGVITLPGKTVEVLGLNRWTVRMIQDSMNKYSPGDSITSHACAAVLRYKLGFADALSMTFRGFGGDTLQHVVVAVVEPQDSARVHHRMMPADTNAAYEPWRAAVEAAWAGAPNVPQIAMRAYPMWRRDSSSTLVPAFAKPDSAAVVLLWRFMANHASEPDYAIARAILQNNPDIRNRIVAVLVLSNFLDRDSTFYALVETVREQDGMAKMMAASLLQSAASQSRRRIDWRPTAASLHDILDGTSVFEIMPVMDALSATGADSTLAPLVLKGGGRMVLTFAAAQHSAPRDSARRLLTALAGRDLGDVAAWRHWVESLK